MSNGLHDRKPRICYIVESASAGVGRHVGDLIERLAEREVAELHVLWSPKRVDRRFLDRLERSNVRHQAIRMQRSIGPRDLLALLEVRAYLRNHGPFDVVHGHSSKGGALARLAAIGSRSRVVYTPHAFAAMDPSGRRCNRWLYRRLELFLAGLTDRVLAVSPEERDFAIEMGIPAGKLSVVPNGIEFDVLPARQGARRELGLGAEDVTVGFVGRLNSQKYPELLVQAFSSIARRFPQARLVIIGDGPLASQVESVVARRGSTGRVILAGARDGRRLMPAFDLLAMPSRYEGFAYVALEALAAGLPLLVTDTASARLTVEDGVNGYVVPVDAAAFAERLGRLLEDEALRQRMGRNSAAKASSFSVDQMVESIWSAYEELCSPGHAACVTAGG